MFDARYTAFAALSALLVMSPGATLAVVVETALGYGRRAALLTVVGVGLANGALASAAALGLSVLVDRWPSSLGVVRAAGGVQTGAVAAERQAIERLLHPQLGDNRVPRGVDDGDELAGVAVVGYCEQFTVIRPGHVEGEVSHRDVRSGGSEHPSVG